jgi:uncharacterized membrane protein
MTHWYLIWNLALAWVPLILSSALVQLLARQRWSEWRPLLITFAWLFFLPNTFYMLTDYIHLNDVPRSNNVFDIAMFSSFVFTGIALGYASLSQVHLELNKRLNAETCWKIITAILLLSGFAIYMGRELRWNSWDIVSNPAGILFDISEHLLHPFSHLDAVTITLSYFALIGFGYYAVWSVLKTLKRNTLS